MARQIEKISDLKKDLRKELGLTRQKIEDRDNKEKRLLDKLLKLLPADQKVFVYVSFSSEMTTHGFIRSYQGSVLVPYTYGGVMAAKKLRSFDNLNTDLRGNLPKECYQNLYRNYDFKAASFSARLDDDQPDIVIVPMLGFDERCFRLGYGGGFYDKYLAGFEGLKIGIAFDEQLCEGLPVEDFDVPLDMILTPNSVFCNNNSKGKLPDFQGRHNEDN